DLRIDVCYSCRKDRQLYLWHAQIVATFGQKKQPSSPSSTRAKPSHLSSSSCLSAARRGSGVLILGPSWVHILFLPGAGRGIGIAAKARRAGATKHQIRK